ncbi:MAG: hypothetical protein KBO60_23490, partial [Achromobacter sp.]|nr:hypothetical protein [Achromobacter sp.]
MLMSPYGFFMWSHYLDLAMRVPMKKYYFPYDGAYGGVGGVRRPYYADPGSKLIAHTDLAAVVVF